MADYAAPPHWPLGDSEMARRVRETDWAATPLGPTESWPQSLKTTVDLILSSGHAMQIAWGPERTMLYNDSYAPMLGERHPRALGIPFREAWPDVWDEVAPLVDRVFAGETVRFAEMPLVLTRNGYPEETWWNFSYSPIHDEAGDVAGLLNVTADATPKVRTEGALRESEERFRALALAGAYSIFRMSADWRYLYQLDSDTLVPTDEPVEDWDTRYVFPDDIAHVRNTANKAIATKSLIEVEHRVFHADGSLGWILSRAVPLLGSDGEIVEWFGASSDVSERHLVAEQREQRERNALFLDQIGIDLARLSDPHEIMSVVGARVGAYIGLTGCVFCDVDEARHEVTIHYGWNSDNVPSLKQTFHLDDYVSEAFWESGRDGRVFIVRDTAHDNRVSAAAYAELQVGAFVVIPFFSGGRWNSYFGATDVASRDWRPDEIALLEEVSERLFARVERARAEVALRESERRLRILVAELQHRVRNIFTVVRSVFNRTIEADGGVQDVAENFRGRLDALARTHTFVTQNAAQTADLRQVIRDELASVGVAPGPLVTFVGPDVTLYAKQAESLALVIHELTTNALKYGALKIAEASLDISWTVANAAGEVPRLELVWAEQGVPGVGLRPDGQGFGRELIEQVLPYRLGAETRLEFLEGGVHCAISLPLPEETAGPPQP
jgi:two-component sensor histidine kinase/PAS domain-containing protein